MTRPFNNLRFRLILLILLAVLPAIGVTLASGIEQRRLARTNAETDAMQLTRAATEYQRSLIEGARQLMIAMALMPEIRGSSQADCNAYLQHLHQHFPLYSTFSLADLKGNLFCSSLAEQPKVNISDRDYFIQALKTDRMVIGQIVPGRITGRLVQPFALAVKDDNEQTKGILIAALEMTGVNDLAQTIRLPDSSALLILKEDGTVLMRYPDSEKWIGQKLLNAPVVQSILANASEGMAEVDGLDGVKRLYAFKPIEISTSQRIYVSVGIPTNVVYASVDRLLWVNLALLGLVLVLALISAWLGGDVLVLNIVSLTAERDAAEQKLRQANLELEERVKERTSELDQTNAKLQSQLAERNRLVRQLSKRETELKQSLGLVERSNRELQDFAHIASHDLQEPLRKVQAFGNRLAQRYSNELGDEGQDYITRMVNAANRMQRMINDLLTYSRVGSRPGKFSSVDLNQTVAEVISDLEIRLEETGGKVNIETLPTIEADAGQIQQLFQNLIANALKFHRPGVNPVIHISAQLVSLVSEPLPDGAQSNGAAYNQVTLCVEDNGIGFEEQYLDRIFQPFQRLHSHSEYEGSGIGLAICRKIVERHNGTITAHSQSDAGSQFIITLPLSQPREESEKS